MSLNQNQSGNSEVLSEEYIRSADTAAFVVRRNDFNNADVANDPRIKMGKVLNGNYMVGYAPSALMSTTLSDNRIFNISIALSPMALYDLEASGVTAVQQQPYLNLNGNGTLLGFVDTGIDYTKSAFQWQDGTTRIRYIWDQSIPGSPPQTYNFGSEYSAALINQALASGDPLSIVPHEDTNGHGTCLASVAGSSEQGMYVGAAPEAEFIVVKLKELSPYYRDRWLIPPDEHDVFESIDVMQGIEYIVSKAIEMNRPVAICIGLGGNGSGHDGYNILEDYLTGLSYQSGVALCCAAGNEADAKHHTMGVLSGVGSSESVEIYVPSNTPNIFPTMWNNTSDRMSVSVTSPTGEKIDRIPARHNDAVTTRLVLENASVVVKYYYPFSGTASQLTSIRILDPSPGIWTINIYGEIVLDGTFHMWLPVTGQTPPGVEFLTPDPNYTVTMPATAVGVIACGAYNSKDKSLYSSSSWGPTRLPAIAPHITAPGVDVSCVLPSGYGTYSGTSVATAILTGACALLLQWGIVQGNTTSMNTYHIKSLLIQGCDRDAWLKYPNDQWGYGRMNLYNTFLQMRTL
jgi:hypothetical protein